jgi:hypothetical protein
MVYKREYYAVLGCLKEITCSGYISLYIDLFFCGVKSATAATNGSILLAPDNRWVWIICEITDKEK